MKDKAYVIQEESGLWPGDRVTLPYVFLDKELAEAYIKAFHDAQSSLGVGWRIYKVLEWQVVLEPGDRLVS